MKRFLPIISIIFTVFCSLIFSCCATAPAVTGRGAAWLSGSGIPAADVGETGDYYLDFDTSAVYEKTAEGWTIRGDLRQTEAAETVTVTFDANGGELPAGYLRENTLEKGDSFALPVPTRAGHEFLGWFYGEGANGGQASDLTVFARDVLLTAKWRKLHTLTLKSEQTTVKIGEDVFLFTGEYDGSRDAKFTLFLEKNGERFPVDDSNGWATQSAIRFTAENGTFSGVVSFSQAGNYRFYVVAEENGERTEASIAVSVTE